MSIELPALRVPKKCRVQGKHYRERLLPNSEFHLCQWRLSWTWRLSWKRSSIFCLLSPSGITGYLMRPFCYLLTFSSGTTSAHTWMGQVGKGCHLLHYSCLLWLGSFWTQIKFSLLSQLYNKCPYKSVVTKRNWSVFDMSGWRRGLLYSSRYSRYSGSIVYYFCDVCFSLWKNSELEDFPSSHAHWSFYTPFPTGTYLKEK